MKSTVAVTQSRLCACASMQVNFISNGDIYEDFHLQTGNIPINRRRCQFVKCVIFVVRVKGYRTIGVR